MARRYGWAPQGERCRASVPFGRRKTTTLIAALRCDRIDAPMTIDGALDGEAFPVSCSNRHHRLTGISISPRVFVLCSLW
jgi:hypothetical protein